MINENMFLSLLKATLQLGCKTWFPVMNVKSNQIHFAGHFCCIGRSKKPSQERMQHNSLIDSVEVRYRMTSSKERQDLSCTYLAHHELGSAIIVVVVIIIILLLSSQGAGQGLNNASQISSIVSTDWTGMSR